ncbi:hypothetical protein C2S51_035494, partial [Perilla frutescens var. frutescens]
MDNKEKLIALQKAYADIILNISKEAAARVLSSEKRAVQYQHELKVAKDEALRMLLRLKQMMDARTSEAEAATLNQQKKIEELEAQLQEAEDIVNDLREELREVQAELERLKKNNLQNVNDSSREVPVTIHSYESSKFLHPKSRDEFVVASEITMSNPSQQNECSKCYYSKKDCRCSSHIRSRHLPSIILRDSYKEPGLYRNGCTQRILACERNLLDKELCLPGEIDSLKDKNKSIGQEEGGYTRKAPPFGVKTLSELENKLLADINLSSFQPFRRKRKRATKQREIVTCLTTKLPDLFQKPDQLPELSTRNIPVSVEDNAHSKESPSTIAPILSPDEAEKGIHQGCEESSGGRVLQNEEGLKEKIVPLGEESGFAESFLPPVCKEAVEKDDMPSNSSEWSLSDSTKGLPSEPVRERIIKYTFQRKRKRGTPSGSEVNVSPEMEKRNEDNKITRKNQDPSKASLLSESSRDSRRLAQVARQ